MKLHHLVALLCAGFVASTVCGCDNTTQIDKKFSQQTYTMTFIETEDIAEVCNKIGGNNTDDGSQGVEAGGCAVIDETKHLCTIYVQPPRYVEDSVRMALVGHETMHCKYGRYHPE